MTVSREGLRPLPADQLRQALETVDGWSQPSSIAATGVHDGYRRVVLVDAGRWLAAAEPFRFALEPFAPIRTAWLSWIGPGGYIKPHRDAGPWRERWQIPIEPAGTITQGGDTFTPRAGEPFRVAHWQEHSVDNPTDRDRIHIVLDRDILLDLPPLPFQLFD